MLDGKCGQMGVCNEISSRLDGATHGLELSKVISPWTNHDHARQRQPPSDNFQCFIQRERISE